MITIEKCREELGEIAIGMTDEQIKGIRDSLYAIAELALDNYMENFNSLNTKLL